MIMDGNWIEMKEKDENLSSVVIGVENGRFESDTETETETEERIYPTEENETFARDVEDCRRKGEGVIQMLGPRKALSRVISEVQTIHEAARYGDLKMVKTLIESGVDIHAPWKDAFGKEVTCKTPLYIAVENGHDHVATTLLDCCVKDEVMNSDQRLIQTFDFQEFKTRESVEYGTYDRRTDALSLIMYRNRQSLIIHRLVRRYLDYQWRTVGRAAYLILCFLHAIFLGVLTTTIFHQKSLESDEFLKSIPAKLNIAVCNSTNSNNTIVIPESRRSIICNDHGSDRFNFTEVGLWYCLTHSVLHLVFEFYQAFLQCCHQSPAYFKSLENWLQLVMFICTIGFTGTTWWNLIGKDATQNLNKWNFASVAVLLAWYQMMMYMRMLPGGYVAMFEVTLKRVFRVFCIFVCAVIGYAFAFYAIRNEHFPEKGKSILKAMSMTLGELNYETLFPADAASLSNTSLVDALLSITEDPGSFEISDIEFSSFLFFIFLLTMPIVLMNLLTGIAVYDVNVLQKTSVAIVYAETYKFLHLLPNCIVDCWGCPGNSHEFGAHDESRVQRICNGLNDILSTTDPFKEVRGDVITSESLDKQLRARFEATQMDRDEVHKQLAILTNKQNEILSLLQKVLEEKQ